MESVYPLAGDEVRKEELNRYAVANQCIKATTDTKSANAATTMEKASYQQAGRCHHAFVVKRSHLVEPLLSLFLCVKPARMIFLIRGRHFFFDGVVKLAVPCVRPVNKPCN